MKKQIITIGGKDYAPILVGGGECCINCDIKPQDCWTQCQFFEELENENIALKEVIHAPRPTKFKKLMEKAKKFLMPIESDIPF